MNHTFDPIGLFHCRSVERYSQPHQPQSSLPKQGYIELHSGHHYEMALSDLKGFEKIWLIYGFHKSSNWNPKVAPPRSPKQKRGLFSTRSPNRPNGLGLSCVDLVNIDGLKVFVAQHDLLDQTPIYDIKPYLPYCDAHPHAQAGWVDEIEDKRFQIKWNEQALQKRIWLEAKGVQLQELIETTLSFYPEANSKKRIKLLDQQVHELSVKTWRLYYELYLQKQEVHLFDIKSGYDSETLDGLKDSKWDDVPIHQLFNQEFLHD